MRVIVKASKTAFLRQPGQRETITVIEAVGVFGQEIPPMIIMKGEKHLYGWYYGEMPAHWTTADSPNGWTEDILVYNGSNVTLGPILDRQKGTTNILDS